MSKLDVMKYRNQIASYVRSFHIKRNVVNLNVHNSWIHEEIKCKVCYELKKLDNHFYTEVPLRSGTHDSKADILILDTGTVIEICVSETLDEVKTKTAKYPRMLEIVAVFDAEAFFEGKYKLIREKEI